MKKDEAGPLWGKGVNKYRFLRKKKKKRVFGRIRGHGSIDIYSDNKTEMMYPRKHEKPGA